MTQIASASEPLAAVRVVLVAPAAPLSVGLVARLMKNFGLSQLVLVAPPCEVLGAEALQVAVHADDILRSALQVGTIPEALVGCEVAIATTARTRGFEAALHPSDAVLPQLITASAAQTPFIVRPAERGLSNTELANATFLTKFPTRDIYSALNPAKHFPVFL